MKSTGSTSIWKVLVVEDEALVAEEIRERLIRLGHDVVGVVDTGEDAISSAQRLHPDLILMDIRIKGEINGIETANRIYKALNIPTIFSTAHSDRDTLKSAQIDGQYGYITKPFQEQDLVLGIRMAMHRYQTESEKLHQIEKRFRGMIENSPNSVIICDPNGKILWANIQTEKMFGHAREALAGQPVQTLVAPHLHAALQRFMENHLASPRVPRVDHESEFYGLRADSSLFPIGLTLSPMETEAGISLSFIIRDVTDLKKKEARIWNQANFDLLTGLPNRNYFQQHLNQAVQDSADSGQPMALLFLDLDRFKEINDTQGHEVGDQVLLAAAGRMRSLIREGDTLARLGGDEFTLIVPRIQDEFSAAHVAQRFLHELSHPIDVKGNRFFLTASIGIAIFPNNADNGEDLLKFADQAMYNAKTLGRNQYAYFSPVLQKKAQEKYELSDALHRALSNDEFAIHFQPIVDLETGEFSKAEALLRWNSPRYGSVGPARFIPLLEETGLIHEVGEWVFDACARFARQLELKVGRPVHINVNISALQLSTQHGRSVDWKKKLAETPGLGRLIGIEITESLLVNNTQEIKDTLRAFHKHGLTISIDDFGTGFSSLSYLKRFDIDYLKIDASFVQGIEHSQDNRVLTEAIIVMANKLRIRTIAEGVETQEQLEVLQSLGCDYVQGYLFSKPLPRAQFETVLASRNMSVSPDAQMK